MWRGWWNDGDCDVGLYNEARALGWVIERMTRNARQRNAV